MKKQAFVQNLFIRLALAAVLIVSFAAAGVGTALASSANGAVYIQTNAACGNAVVAYQRSGSGALSLLGSFATGGSGSGGGLGSQGSLALSEDHRFLFVVNAGSNDVSSFATGSAGLKLLDRAASGGLMPVSVTVHEHMLYVLNAGGAGNITGFKVSDSGKLRMLDNSTRFLSNGGAGVAPGPAEVLFDRQGKLLAVTEKGTNLIDTYAVDDNGYAGDAMVHASVGVTPFGFYFGKRGTLVVSEAFGGAPDQGAVSSYLADASSFSVASGSVHTNQTAACWLVVTENGKYAYTTNAGSASVSGYRIGRDGSLALLAPDGRSGLTGGHPSDMGIGGGNDFLYTLDNNSNQISAFAINDDGSLAALSTTPVPAGVVGLASW